MCVWAFRPTAPLMAAEGRGKKKKGRIRRIEKLVVGGGKDIKNVSTVDTCSRLKAGKLRTWGRTRENSTVHRFLCSVLRSFDAS